MYKKIQKQMNILVDGLLYVQHKDMLSVVNNINELLSKPQFEIRVLVLVSIKNIFKTIEDQSFDEFTLKKTSFSNNILVGSLNRKYGRRISKNEINGKFLLIKHSLPYVYLVITEGDSVFVKDGLETFFRKSYPKISFPFLKTEQIEQILENLESQLEDRAIRLKTVGSKSRITSTGARKKYESIRKWTDLTFAEAFEVAKENDELITSISFQLFNHHISSFALIL